MGTGTKTSCASKLSAVLSNQKVKSSGESSTSNECMNFTVASMGSELEEGVS